MDIKFGFQPPSEAPSSPVGATESPKVGVGQGPENFSAELLSGDEPDYTLVAHTPIGLAHFHSEVA